MGIMKKLTKLMAAVLMAVMLTGILPVAAHAAGREAKVTSYMLNVRAGAAQEYTIIDVAYEGNTMDVLEELPNGWGVRFSAVPMYDADGRSCEFGIAPDVEVQLTDEDFLRGKDTIIEAARKLLSK